LGHEAGNDLTDQMEIAPHSDEVMERMKKVGTLV
jgi:predicted heme/steroid binding protein